MGNPDEDKKLRQLLLMKRKLPEPSWNLFARASKRWSQVRPRFDTIESQAAAAQRIQPQQQRKETSIKVNKVLQEDKEESKAHAYNVKQTKRVEKLIQKKYKGNPEKVKEEIQEMRDRGWDKYRI